MKLSESTAVIRPRTGWEAIDLGIRMVQRDFWSLVRRWVISTLPWFVLFVASAQLIGDAALGMLLFWWMKPAFDRVILDHLSQRLFSTDIEEPGPFDVWFRLPLSASVWRQLTYLRFSLVRSFTLPVYQLEGVNSGTRERIRTLINRDYGASACLTLLFMLLSYFLHYVIMGTLADWMHPEPVVLSDSSVLDYLFEATELFDGPLLWINFFVFYLVTGILELFFVGAGFALYINRRTHLEAWDIELSFRRMAERLSRGAQLAIPLLIASLAVAPVLVAQAQQTLPSVEEARETAREIYAGEEFGEQINDRVWRLKESEEEFEERENKDLFSVFGPFVSLLAVLIKYLVVGLFVIAISIWLYRERKRLLRRSVRTPPTAHSSQVTTDAEEALFTPDNNVPGEVLRLWSEGKTRESLSYLYRSALSYLVDRHALKIGDHATEEDCLNLVKANASSDVSAYFGDITRQWRLLAYGKRQPQDSVVEHLCSQWSRIAERPSGRPTTSSDVSSQGTATSA